MKNYRIQFGSMKIDNRSKKHIDDVIESNWVSGGKKCTELEEKWGKLFNYKHNVTMSNGTDADIAACLVLYDKGAKRGDEIIAPALGFVAVGNSIMAAGFKPVFVDVDRETMNLNPNKIEEKITNKTKGIMAVHTMGKPCDLDAIMNISKSKNLYVIEDSCEAHGAKYNGKFIGSFGDVATFSYFVAHLISAGDGGMASTNNPEIYDILRSVKNHGRKPDEIFFDHVRHGSNFRLNEFTAALALPQIDDFWNVFQQRKDNLNYLLNKTKDLEEYAIFNKEEVHEVTCPHAFSLTLRHPKFNYGALYNFLEDSGIMCKRNFGSMPTQHKAFKFLGHELGEFPEAEYVGDNGLHFGIHNQLSKDDLNYASDKLHEYFKKF